MQNVLKKYNIPKEISFTLHQEEGGYWVDSSDLPGLITQGDTIDDTIENLEDAILTYFDVPRKEARQLSRFLHAQFNAEGIITIAPEKNTAMAT